MKYSFGSSFATAPNALTPQVFLDAVALQQGDSTLELPERVSEVSLVVHVPQVDVDDLLVISELASGSKITLRVDLDCPGFDFSETLLSHDMPSSGRFCLSRREIAVLPRSVIVEGFSLRMSLVASRPVPSGPRGCSIPGGILSSWETRVPARNRASMFPVQDADEPALWRLDIDLEEPEDLERPLRAAMRLFVDSARLECLLGREADPDVRGDAVRWLQAESFTAVVLHVLANEPLRDHVAAWLSAKPPIEKSLDPKSIGNFVVRVMRRLSTTDLSELRLRVQSQPVETTREIRRRFAIDVSSVSARNVKRGVAS